MSETKIINKPELRPLRHDRTPLYPNSVLRHYTDIGKSDSYFSYPGKNCWRGIVTNLVLPGQEDAPILFDLAGGLSKEHQSIATALETTERSFNLGHAAVQLRLESEEDNLELCAEMIYHNGNPMESDLQLAASLLQAANQAPNPYGKTYEHFVIKTFSRNQHMAWEVTHDDFTDQTMALPVYDR